MPDLSGNIALVTGASAGLGRAFTTFLSACGATVVCAARSADRLETVVAELRQAGAADATFETFDAARDSGADDLFANVRDRIGVPSILINNAGLNLPGRAHEIVPGQFDQLMKVNLRTPWRLSQLCAEQWIAGTKSASGSGKNPGVVVNVASILGRRVQAGVSIYAMSKAALQHMTAAHAVEWARYGIRVNAINPGYFGTEINDQYWSTQAGRRERERLPRRRIGDVDQLRSALLFLVDPASDFVNGASIDVDDAQGWVI